MTRTIDIRGELKDEGYCWSIEGTTIKRLAGVSTSYGPGGFGLGLSSDRSEGFLFGLAGVIDNHGGTGAEWRATPQLIDELAEGDVLLIAGEAYELNLGPKFARKFRLVRLDLPVGAYGGLVQRAHNQREGN